ncbi:hypothetical protein [Streptomyces sp. NPDC058295]|uniref:hypothetical protein n=1 Tax=Streptomyces sp. NPDC058295 TaxID=3346431 RepID=UPI0036DFC2FE
MPTPVPPPRPRIPAQRPPTVWETDQLFRQPEYTDGSPWISSEDSEDEEEGKW